MSNYYTEKKKPEPRFGIKQLGTTAALLGQELDPVQNLRAKIFAGAGSIEMFAPGVGQANASQSPSFENIQNDQRQAIRELIRVNKVDVSTHAATQIQLAGMNREGFDRETQERNFIELKKAIDFSAEAANGGAVVVHAGEFPRPLGTKTPKKWKNSPDADVQFQTYAHEEKEGKYYLADKRTGNLVALSDETSFIVPEYKKDKDGKYIFVKDAKGKPVVDDLLKENLLEDDFYKKKYGTDFEKYPEFIKAQAYLKELDMKDNGEFKTRKENLSQFIGKRKNEMAKEGVKYSDSEFSQILRDFFRERASTQARQEISRLGDTEEQYELLIKKRKFIIKDIEFMERLKKEDPEMFELKKREMGLREPQFGGLSGMTETKDPIELLKEELKRNTAGLTQVSDLVAGYKASARQKLEQVNDVVDIEKVGLERSAETVAKSAIYAWQKYPEAKGNRPEQDNMKPIQLAIENIFPTMQGQDYGSHPEELINIIELSRKKMVEDLLAKNMIKDKKEAQKIAEQHIGATLDTGHLNTWKKHMVRKENESNDEFENRFKGWFTGQVEKLAKGGFLANVHLADNFGYDDVHLTPGQGNAPINEVLGILKKHKYGKKIQAEGGWGPGQESGLNANWKLGYAQGVGMSVYRQGTDGWTNPNSRFYSVHDGYHTQANKPYFVFGGYSPEAEEWKPWSGSKME